MQKKESVIKSVDETPISETQQSNATTPQQPIAVDDEGDTFHIPFNLAEEVANREERERRESGIRREMREQSRKDKPKSEPSGRGFD